MRIEASITIYKYCGGWRLSYTMNESVVSDNFDYNDEQVIDLIEDENNKSGHIVKRVVQ